MLTLIEYPHKDWVNEARCIKADPEIFYPISKNDPKAEGVIQAYCRNCPVEGDCLGYALAKGEQGIWGGMTEEQRRAIRRKQSRVKCPRCSSIQVHATARYEVCIGCGLSWPTPTIARSRKPSSRRPTTDRRSSR